MPIKKFRTNANPEFHFNKNIDLCKANNYAKTSIIRLKTGEKYSPNPAISSYANHANHQKQNKLPNSQTSPCKVTTTKSIAQNFLSAYNYRAMQKNFKNILIVKPSSLGDIVLTLPVLSALRRNFPDSKISWLMRPDFMPLLKNHPHLTEVIPFNRRFLGKAWFNPRAMASLLSLIRKLRHSRFDVVFDFQGLFRTASLVWLTGCKNRFGMTNAREFSHIFYTHKVSQSKDCVHLVDYYLKIIQAAGADDLDVQFVLPQEPNAVNSANRLLARYGITPGNYVIFIPGSVHSDKRWPIEHFAALADRITSRFHLPIVATGVTSEKSVTDSLETISNVPITNLAGLTSLSELITLLKSARLVVSNDTGPGHIAAALGTPLVMIFGRSNPVRVAPYGRKNCVAAVEPDERGLAISSSDPKYDIRAITIDDVFQKVCQQIGS